MKKAFKLLTALAVITLTLTACGGGGDTKTSAKSLDIGTTMDNIVKTAKFDDELIELTDKNVSDYYEIDTNFVAEYKIMVSATGATTEEIAIFKLGTDDKAAEAVKKLIDDRKASLTKSFEDYIPAEVARIDEAITVENGGYILFSISSDSETIKKTFEDALK